MLLGSKGGDTSTISAAIILTPESSRTTFKALKVVRELSGVKIIAADMVEVSPPFDPSSNTAFLGVSVMFELLCQMVN